MVASDRSGAAEKVRPGRTGFVVPPEIGPLAAAFTALRDDACARSLGAEARRRFRAAPMALGGPRRGPAGAVRSGWPGSLVGALQHPGDAPGAVHPEIEPA